MEKNTQNEKVVITGLETFPWEKKVKVKSYFEMATLKDLQEKAKLLQRAYQYGGYEGL